eukprot:GILK01015814.1.p1 GENE.GILK01015814.1~~GILK01015814.1.p1  ORF type:complete len:260 (-),score=37.20 GILK01015814.1:232-921(-)
MPESPMLVAHRARFEDQFPMRCLLSAFDSCSQTDAHSRMEMEVDVDVGLAVDLETHEDWLMGLEEFTLPSECGFSVTLPFEEETVAACNVAQPEGHAVIRCLLSAFDACLATHMRPHIMDMEMGVEEEEEHLLLLEEFSLPSECGFQLSLPFEERTAVTAAIFNDEQTARRSNPKRRREEEQDDESQEMECHWDADDEMDGEDVSISLLKVAYYRARNSKRARRPVPSS